MTPPLIPDYEDDRPRLVGSGPATCPATTALVRYRRIVWDVNCYYCSLGVDPYATRTQIRQAYQRLDGSRSPRLTYIVSQLLKPKVRASYDATPLGAIFIDDDVEIGIRRIVARKAAEAMGRGEKIPEDPYEMVDFEVAERAELSDPPETMPLEPEWRYSYYLWRSDCDDKRRLALWQAGLVREVSKRKEGLQIAVGFHGFSQDPWRVERVGYRIVAFLHHGAYPTDRFLAQASQAIIGA